MITTHSSILFVLMLLFGAISTHGQSDFQNLDFELANLPTLPPGQLGGSVLTVDGMPGWTTFVGVVQVTSILHNQEYLDTASVSVLGPNYAYGPILEGQYTGFLQAGYDPFSTSLSDRASASISQTGTVPLGTESIHITTGANTTGLQITFAGFLIPLVVIESTPNYSIFAGDFSSVAGSSGELQLTALPVAFYNGFNRIYLDDIQFSSIPIPEPSTPSLFVLGVLLLVGCRLKGFCPHG